MQRKQLQENHVRSVYKVYAIVRKVQVEQRLWNLPGQCPTN